MKVPKTPIAKSDAKWLKQIHNDVTYQCTYKDVRSKHNASAFQPGFRYTSNCSGRATRVTKMTPTRPILRFYFWAGHNCNGWATTSAKTAADIQEAYDIRAYYSVRLRVPFVLTGPAGPKKQKIVKQQWSLLLRNGIRSEFTGWKLMYRRKLSIRNCCFRPAKKQLEIHPMYENIQKHVITRTSIQNEMLTCN